MSGAEPGAPAYDLTSNMVGAQRGNYFQATQWIERVVIRNFRPIRELEIDLAKSTSERGPWTVLLGENGCGKSSVLHAIALTMMGGEQRRALGIDARKFLRDGARKGLVEVYLSGRQEPLRLEWAKGEHEFTGPEPVAALMLGYGAVRLLPRTPSPHSDDQAWCASTTSSTPSPPSPTPPPGCSPSTTTPSTTWPAASTRCSPWTRTPSSSATTTRCSSSRAAPAPTSSR